MPSWRTSTPTRPACGSCAVGPGSRPPSRLSPTTNQKRRDHTGLVLAYSFSNRSRQMLIARSSNGGEGLSIAELQSLLADLSQAPPGIPGLSRSLIALTVIMILGICLFYILFANRPLSDSPIIGNILSA